jgi:ComF family protein
VKKHVYYRGTAVFRYRSVSGSLYRFKYEGRREYADYYGREMARALDRFIEETGPAHIPQVLVPVPCSAQRIRKRGYDQAAVLAQKTSEIVQIPVDTEVLKRSKDTKAMRSMSALERQNNLKKAFHVYGNGVRLKSIMLIDDIYTTGATIDACSGALLGAGAKEVNFLTLAIGENTL